MEFPSQSTGPTRTNFPQMQPGRFDMRDWLNPRRLTFVLWDYAYLFRHIPGESFESYDRVLDQAIERGYNTLRIDPLPQLVDLAHPEKCFRWSDPQRPYMPWCYQRPGEGHLGQWMIEFMEKLLTRPLNYTLSAWWTCSVPGSNSFPTEAIAPHTHLEAAELWAKLLREWKRRFGFDRLVYVDIANETPYFLPGFMDRIKAESGQSWNGDGQVDFNAPFGPRLIEFVSNELNGAMSMLQREFPEVRFTSSIHGDERWLDIPLQFDCLDVHFYSDMDLRWRQRTRFDDWMPNLFTDASWHKEFSQRCQAARNAIAPMLRVRQRSRLASFSSWSEQHGMPLTTSESWASWYYIDSPELDWSWLLEWAEWSVEDALEYHMWGWTPHNYTQPQFKNWQDVGWHRRLTDRFLRS
jgi:hypothetical protein